MKKIKPVTSKQLILEQDWSGRKYRSAWLLTWLFTSMLVLPCIFSILLTLLNKTVVNFSVLPAEVYAMLIGGIWLGYFGANVYEKKFNGFRKPSLIDSTNLEQPPEGYNS